MKDVGSEQSQDDFEVEITDLGGPSFDLPGFQKVLLKPGSLSHRYRAMLTIAITCIMTLALILLAAPPMQQWFTHAEQATPPVEPGVSFFTVQANPPWGRLFVDDQAVSLPSPGAPLVGLSIGQHELTWRAEPFQAQHCIFTVPVGSGIDTCKHPLFLPGGTGSPDAVIRFPASLDLLPDSQRAALLRAAQAALDSGQSSETVQVGEVYALSSDVFDSMNYSCKLAQNAVYCYTMTKQPLRATLVFQLDTDISRSAPCSLEECVFNGEDCRLFCDTSAFGSPATSSSQWQIFAIVHALWQYTTLDGQKTLPEQADTFIRGMQNEHHVLLHITWNGQLWHVTTSLASPQFLFNDPACDAGTGDAFSLLNAAMTQNGLLNIAVQSIPGITPASGCLVKFALQAAGTGESLTPTSAPVAVAYCLHRFGVLLAVNTTAHRLWPFLPLADAYEQQLVKQLAAGT